LKKGEGGPKGYLFGNRTNAEERRAVKSPDVEKSRSANRVIVIGVGNAGGFGNLFDRAKRPIKTIQPE
jgi:hypothetical protein